MVEYMAQEEYKIQMEELLKRIAELENRNAILARQLNTVLIKRQMHSGFIKTACSSSYLETRRIKPGHCPYIMQLMGRVIPIRMTFSSIRSATPCTCG